MTEWTAEAIRALGPTTDIPTLASIFDCSPWKAYEMARKGEWEAMGVRVVRLGPKYRVIVPSLLEVLSYLEAGPPGEGEGDTAGPGEIPVDRRYEDLLAAIWLYIPWYYVTKQLTTEQKDLFADAIDAHSARINAAEPEIGLTPAQRWWRDGQ